MKVIVLLLGVSMSVSLFFLLSYIFSSKEGQFDDTYSPAHRIFYEDESKQK